MNNIRVTVLELDVSSSLKEAASKPRLVISITEMLAYREPLPKVPTLSSQSKPSQTKAEARFWVSLVADATLKIIGSKSASPLRRSTNRQSTD
jgi:hypothetical protein